MHRPSLIVRRRPAQTGVLGTLSVLVLAVTSVAASGTVAQATPAAATVTVTTDRAVYTVAEGGTARVGVTVTTDDGAPLAADEQVPYATEADVAPASGTLTFPAGTPSGTTQWVSLAAPQDDRPETAQAAGLTVGGEAATVVVNANGLPYLDARLPTEQRVADLLGRMTLEEKVGQMTQTERNAVFGDPSLIAEWMVGSVLSGGGSTPPVNEPAAWLEMINEFQAQALTTRLQIPLIYGIDAVHGLGIVQGATIFPHNVGLGATRDRRLVEAIGEATAAETRGIGVPWNFAPCLCVTRDDRWGRSYESYSENPGLVTQLGTAMIDGLQDRDLSSDSSVIATPKHFAGDGHTQYDEAVAEANEGLPPEEQAFTIDQGITVTNQRDFLRLDVSPYASAIHREDVTSVMPSFSSVDFTEDGVGNPIKMHAHRDLITGLLKGRLGFDGFVISDWEGIHQIPDPSDPTNTGLTPFKVRTAANAGIDLFMQPNNAPVFSEMLLAEVEADRVSTSRIDDAVGRILHAKFELGLFDQPFASDDNLDEVGSAEHRALAREAVAESQVLLRNDRRTLPLAPEGNIYVAGRNADDIGNQAGGWTTQWQGVSGDDLVGTTILEGIREVAPDADITFSEDASAPMDGADVGIVVVGETPYSEGFGDIGGPEWQFGDPELREEKSLSLLPGDRAVVDAVCGAIETCVVLIVSGRPQVVTDQLDDMDALVASWLPGSEGAGVADVLFGREGFSGRLPVSWPRSEDQVPINIGDRGYDPLFPYGWGLRTRPSRG